MIWLRHARRIVLCIVVVVIACGLDACGKGEPSIKYRPISVYKSCSDNTASDMEVYKKDVSGLDGPFDICLEKDPLAKEVPIDSVEVVYEKGLQIYDVRIFPNRTRAGSLFYALNSQGFGDTSLSVVVGNDVVAHLVETSRQNNGFVSLGGFDKKGVDRFMHVLVVND